MLVATAISQATQSCCLAKQIATAIITGKCDNHIHCGEQNQSTLPNQTSSHSSTSHASSITLSKLLQL
jgi:thiazole synthase ThiGH ThiG subunit